MNLKGKVSRIFLAKENGFKILVLEVDDAHTIPADKQNPNFPDSVTVVGMMKDVACDYVLELTGEWEYRPSGTYWPWQFKTSNIFVCELETPILMRKFLSGITCVGPELAKKIQAAFSDPQEVIERQPMRLTSIPGVSEQKAIQIQAAFLAKMEKNSLGSLLYQFGFKSDEIKNISSTYGVNAMRIIRANPYRLCDDHLATFEQCDHIGASLGIPADNHNRIKCAMNCVLLTRAGAMGHVYLNEAMLLEETNLFFKDNAAIKSFFTEEELADKLHNLVADNELVYENEHYYHPERYRNERDVAHILIRRAKHKGGFAGATPELILECEKKAEADVGFTLDDLQREAVVMAIMQSTVVITGGPGSGKTTLLNTYIKTLEYVAQALGKRNPSFALAAPTGMAAKRMASSTGKEAKTIHKLFDIRYDLNETIENPVQIVSDVVILDEVSMLDIDIMAHILRTLTDSTALILIGDVDQIPSIGPGNVLADIISSGVVPVTRLRGSYRQGKRKTILTNAIKINSGDDNLQTNRSDFIFYKVKDKVSDRDCKRLKSAVERVFCEEFLACGRDPYCVQVISPLRTKTLASVDELNVYLQKIANPWISDAEQIECNKVFFRKGDKVMQVFNNYDKGVYNGDVGIITEVSLEKKKLRVDFQGLTVEYVDGEFDQLKHAFATTVHKVQGSQFPVVIMVVTNFHSMMLLRNLLYTGVTRAQQRLIIVGDEDAVKYAIRNTKDHTRLSALAEKLAKAM